MLHFRCTVHAEMLLVFRHIFLGLLLDCNNIALITFVLALTHQGEGCRLRALPRTDQEIRGPKARPNAT